jgi:hypothetical protein
VTEGSNIGRGVQRNNEHEAMRAPKRPGSRAPKACCFGTGPKDAERRERTKRKRKTRHLTIGTREFRATIIPEVGTKGSGEMDAWWRGGLARASDSDRGEEETHASYIPPPTMFKGITMPPGPPVPSSLGSSLCSARALLLRESGNVLGDMREIRMSPSR